MNATILNYRRGINTQHNYQYLIEVNDEKYNSKEKVNELLGKTVIYKTSSNKQIKGKITHTHGNKGVLRVRFEKGLPGEAISQKVEIK
jgi:large subunit ribosomal protein L35Ae